MPYPGYPSRTSLASLGPLSPIMRSESVNIRISLGQSSVTPFTEQFPMIILIHSPTKKLKLTFINTEESKQKQVEERQGEVMTEETMQLYYFFQNVDRRHVIVYHCENYLTKFSR